MAGGRYRSRTERRGADEHVRHGHGAGQASLQPRRHLRCADDRRPACRFPCRTGQGELTAMIALTVSLAVLVGMSLGLLGGGGSILMVPLLAYVAGMEPKHAI